MVKPVLIVEMKKLFFVSSDESDPSVSELIPKLMKLDADIIIIEDPEEEVKFKGEEEILQYSVTTPFPYIAPYIYADTRKMPAELSAIKEAKKTAPKTINRYMRHKHIRRK